MFQGVADLPNGDQLIPFIRQFHEEPSTFVWEDKLGEVHTIRQGEGGEPRRPLDATPLQEGERLFAYLDDIYVVCAPERVGKVYLILEECLRTKTGINIHLGKTKLWNRAGAKPDLANSLSAAQAVEPEAVVWRGDPQLPLHKQGLTVLGVPVGQPEFVVAELTAKAEEHASLFEKITHIPDVQIGWLLLVFCAATRANYWLQTVSPELTEGFARRHDHEAVQCMCRLLQVEQTLGPSVLDTARMPLSLGGLGVGGGLMTRDAAHWGSWADNLEMIAQRHPPVAQAIVNGVGTASGCFASVVAAIARLQEVGVEIPTWQVLALGLTPPPTNDEREPSQPRHGWQKYASTVVQKFHREQVVLPSLSPAEQAMVRSQSGPLASVPFTAMPIQRVSRIDSEEFRVLVLRRLRLPLPLSLRSCRCGRPSTSLATTGQCVAQRGCSAGGDLLWRTRWHRSVVKAEQGCQPTCSCGTWTSHQLAAQIPVDLKLWRRDSPCMEDASWP